MFFFYYATGRQNVFIGDAPNKDNNERQFLTAFPLIQLSYLDLS